MTSLNSATMFQGSHTVVQAWDNHTVVQAWDNGDDGECLFACCAALACGCWLSLTWWWCC